MYDENNTFSKILRKEIPCEVVYEDKNVLFFNDINPQAKIHVLGVPKIKVLDFSDFMLKADEEIVRYFFLKVHEVIIDLGLREIGYKIISNSGENGGQEVPHFHIHIMGGGKQT